MHQANRLWLDDLKKDYRQAFVNQLVLDLGSLDINGSARPWFEGCGYTGVDRTEGKGVDIVGNVRDINFVAGFNTIISFNSFMYDKEWDKSLKSALGWLRTGGLFFVSFADDTWDGSKRGYPDTEEGNIIDISFKEFISICEENGMRILEAFYDLERYPKDLSYGKSPKCKGTANIVAQKL